VGLFFYAGHGIQVEGRNYLIPVGADIQTEADVKYKAVDAGLVLDYMEEADAALNIVILDACRDNPYARRFRSTTRGLARLDMPVGELGSLLGYSTAPGQVAADGAGRNSPYTKYLLQALKTPGLRLMDVFQKVRISVYDETHGKQIPWVSESLLGDFYFLESTHKVSPPSAPALTVQSDPDDAHVRILNIEQPYHPGIRLKPGRYHVQVSKKGYERNEQWISIKDADQTVTITLRALPKRASVTIRSNVYDDKVYIDGSPKGSTRLDLDLEPGWHTVRVEKGGYEAFEERIELSSGAHRVVRATLKRRTEIPTENELRRRGLRRLRDAELSELVSGNTLYYESLRDGAVIPVYYLRSGRRRLIYENRLFEGGHWVSNDALCVESVVGGDICTRVYKDGEIYRICDPRAGGECRLVVQRIRADNPERLLPDSRQTSPGARMENGGPIPGTVWTEPLTGMEFIWVPEGCVERVGPPNRASGEDADRPKEPLCVAGFWLGASEVTNRQYRLFRPDHDSGDFEGHSLDDDEQPVVNVSWRQAVAFGEWLSERSGQALRLPTEAEWEYGARAGGGPSRYWGDDPSEVCRYANGYDLSAYRAFRFDWPPLECDDGFIVSAPIERFPPNRFGLFDMLGVCRT
jgi:hypothetical protein